MGAPAGVGQGPFYLAGRLGHDGGGLAPLIDPVGCGCEMLLEASRLVGDREKRGVFEADGPQIQRRWSCPSAGYPLPAGADALDAGCRAVVADVERATGTSLPPTCPKWPTRLAWVDTALRARAWREHGCMVERVGWPSLALCEAIDEIDRGYADRLAWQDAEAERKRRAPADGSDPATS